MKNFKVIAVIIVFLMAISATSLLAQGRQTRTRGAKAAYGYPTGEFKSTKKKKKLKQRKSPKRKSKGAEPLYRKKNPWAN